MNYHIFQSLPEDSPKNPKVGDIFLSGVLIEQKATKMKEGEQIQYYKVVTVKKTDYGVNIEYVQEYDTLEY